VAQVVKFIPPEIIDEIRIRSDIIEIVSEYVRLKKQGKNYVGLCPFHLEDTPSFTVSPDKQIFYCFGCQKGGNVINFIMEQENLTFPEAAELLAGKSGIVIPVSGNSMHELAKQSQKQMLIEMHEISAEFFHANLMGKNGITAREYLDQRQIRRDIIHDFQLGYAPDSWDSLKNHLGKKGFSQQDMETGGLIVQSSKGSYYDKFRNRLIFPIRDYRGKVIAFGGRTLGDELPKYLNTAETPIFHKSRILYGLNYSAGYIRQYDEAIIMEGYMDVISAWQFGINNAVASLGTSLTQDQGKLLKRYSPNVLIAYDADTAGVKATYRGLEILQNLGLRVRVIELPNNLDPDEFLRKYNNSGWNHLVKNKALSLFEYKLKRSLSRYDLKTIEGKADVVQDLLPDISRIKSQVEKDEYIQLLSKTLEITPNAIYSDLGRINRGFAKTDNFTGDKHTNCGSIKIGKAYMLAEINLFKLMIEDKSVFSKVEQVLGLDFSEDSRVNDVLHLIKNECKGYNWIPATLIGLLENIDLKQFVSEILMQDFPEGNNNKIVEDCIKAIRLNRLKKRISEIKVKIDHCGKQNITGEMMHLLQEYAKLQQQIQQLKG
jgi:DNA primase